MSHNSPNPSPVRSGLTGFGHQLWAPMYYQTCEATKPERPEPLSCQSVIEHSQGVAGVVQLAASYDPKVIQRHQTHWHLGDEHIALYLNDPLKKKR